MLCVVIKGPSLKQVYSQITRALPLADVLELRIDCFEEFSLDQLKQLQIFASCPLIFTLRSPNQGGFYTKSKEQWLHEIAELASLKPKFLDLDSIVPLEFIRKIQKDYPTITLILSFHDLKNTPSNLSQILESFPKLSNTIYKIATTSHSVIDSLRLLTFTQSIHLPVAVMAMGETGEISRILGPIVNSLVTYASLSEEEKTALGQVLAKTLNDIYHFHTLNRQTAIYGLIGNPLHKSIGHYLHNAIIERFRLNAVYVKMPITQEELPSFFSLIAQLPIRGLSVTRPLKEQVLSYLDEMDTSARMSGAVNTIQFKDNRLYGYNTDGKGAVQALEEKGTVQGKQVVILGAGGAAKALIYELKCKGAYITILNRDRNKSEAIAQHFNCQGSGLEDLPAVYQQGYDILVNCTPLELPIDPTWIIPHTLVMDMTTNPKETLLLKHAQQKKCSIVFGYQMFINQALQQISIWFDGQVERLEAYQMLQQKALDHLLTLRTKSGAYSSRNVSFLSR